MTRIPFDVAAWVVTLPLPKAAVLAVIFLIYIIGGMVMLMGLFLLWNASFIISRFLYPAIAIMLPVAAWGLAACLRQSLSSVRLFAACAAAAANFA